MSDSDDNLAFATVAEAGLRMRRGDTSSVALTELMLGRIDALDGKINAYITVMAEQALAQAAAADLELSQGADRGPLHGIPVAAKDLFATAGVRTTAGSKLFEDAVPTRDAAAIARLKDAGAVLLGKTGLHELAWGTTSENPFFGAIHNPWALDHHPGGSSGGSAAAVAAGLAYAALGTDTGASVRQPAHCCGITGYKPSYGRISRAGVVPLAWSLDHVGVLTRTAGDARLALDVLAGPDPEDPYTIRPGWQPLPVPSNRLDGARIGVPRGFFVEGGEAEVIATVDGALAEMSSLGCELIAIDLPGAEDAHAAAAALFAEVHTAHGAAWRENPQIFSGNIQARFEEVAQITADGYAAAQHFRHFFRAQVDLMMLNEGLLALATPTSVVAAAKIGGPARSKANWRNTGIFNFTGQPSISVPCGFTEAGMPVGLMLTGRMNGDQTVLDLAGAYQAATSWHRQHPMWVTESV